MKQLLKIYKALGIEAIQDMHSLRLPSEADSTHRTVDEGTLLKENVFSCSRSSRCFPCTSAGFERISIKCKISVTQGLRELAKQRLSNF